MENILIWVFSSLLQSPKYPLNIFRQSISISVFHILLLQTHTLLCAISNLFQKIPIIFENYQLNNRKSQLYFIIINWILENCTCISEFSIVFQKINIHKQLIKQLKFSEIHLSFSEIKLWFLIFICDFVIFNWGFWNKIGVFWNMWRKWFWYKKVFIFKTKSWLD